MNEKDDSFGREFVLYLKNGNSIHTDAFDDNPEGSSYVRLCGPDGREFAYWTYEEWVSEPQLVMGAILGAAGSKADA